MLNTQLAEIKQKLPILKPFAFVLLALIMVYIVTVHVSFHENAHVSYNAQTSITWLQPKAVDETFPLLIKNRQWHLDFTDIEKVIWKSKITSDGELVINSETLELLKQAVSYLPKDISHQEFQRVTFLIKKSTATLAGKRLAKLLPDYYYYQQDYQSILSAINKARGSEKLTLIKTSGTRYQQLQEKYFGQDIAAKLFDKKNTTVNYFNQRRIIHMSENISPTQKKERLAELERKYKRALKDNQ